MKMCDSSSDMESIDDSLSEIRDAASSDTNHLLDRKTVKVYDKNYQDFMNWKMSNNKQSFKEKVLLEYFVELSSKYKYSTLSTNFSILKKTLSQHHNVDISKYYTVIALIKRKAEGYTGRKSKTFSPEDINKFLREAHDNEYLFAKVALIFGIVGGCRRQELYNLQFKDVEILGSRILVKVKNAKTKVERIFTLTGHYYELCKKYISLRPDPCYCTTFFVNYKASKCMPLSVGINQFGKVGKTIAKFLGLPNPDLYTGHCFKRTSATILVDSDGDILPYRGHIRYKTTRAPETESRTKDSIGSSHENNSLENINKTSTTTLEGCSNNTIESFIQELNCPNSLENENIGYINVDVPIPNTREIIDESLESKDEVWNQLKISFSKESNDVMNTTPGTSVLEDYLDGSTDGEDQGKNPNQNPLEDSSTDKIVNINIPSTSNNLQHALSTLVSFNNCNIHNINVNNYSK